MNEEGKRLLWDVVHNMKTIYDSVTGDKIEEID